MTMDIDRRTYDLLRIINENGPIGSIRLVNRLQRRGYSIKGRTVRLTLSELDKAGLTEKVIGKGRRLTDAGRAELARGDISGRLEQIRERISTLTSKATYDPTEDVGELVVGAGRIAHEDLTEMFDLLSDLHRSAVGPVFIAVDAEGDDGRASGVGSDVRDDRGNDAIRLTFPSSITLESVLLSHGIDARLMTAGLVEYNGKVCRYIDTISGENATIDVVSLLIDAGRTDVSSHLDDEPGVLIVDNREFPLARFEETRDLSEATREQLGGVLDIRRPREPGPFPAGSPGWEFASLTYGGAAEQALALLSEYDLLVEWESLAGLRTRSAFESVAAVRERYVE
jgi:repressor of nif and glnA expression